MPELYRHAALALCALLATAVAPQISHAGSFAVYEASAGPGQTAQFPSGLGQQADIDFDASLAEGGGIYTFGELTIVPFGVVALTGFTCQVANCVMDVVLGSELDGAHIKVTGGEFDGQGPGTADDPGESGNPQSVYDLGLIDFDAGLVLLTGGLRLTGCNYTSADQVERTCETRVLVNVPEPGSAALLLLGLLGLRRRRSGARGR